MMQKRVPALSPSRAIVWARVAIMTATTAGGEETPSWIGMEPKKVR